MTPATIHVMPTTKPAACSAYTTVVRVLRLFSSAIDLHPFLPRPESRNDAHAALRHSVVCSEKFDQGVVCFAVDRARGEAHLDPLAVASREFRAGGAGLDVQIENHSDAIAGRMFQSTISATWIRITSASGVRSNWPSGGM